MVRNVKNFLTSEEEENSSLEEKKMCILHIGKNSYAFQDKTL